MSYILDALRKSEQERRNQEAVTSFSVGTMDPQSGSETQGNPWVWIAVAIVLSINVLAFLFIFKDEIVSADKQEQIPTLLGNNPSKDLSAEVKPRLDEAVVEERFVEERPLPRAIPSQDGVQLPEKYLAPNQTSAERSFESQTPEYQVGFEYSDADVIRPKPKDRLSGSDSLGSEDISPIGSQDKEMSLAERYKDVQMEQRAPKYEVINASESASAPNTVNLREQLLDGLQEPQVIKPSAGHSKSVNSNHYSQAEAEKLPRIMDLSRDQQAMIPPIRFSGHLYSSRPESRSIRLEGVKYKEGDRISRAVSVHTITEDGVVLDLEGNLFYISSFEDWNGIR
ncbi:general secretion pathway protein GspB [Litoribrevibacter albus]|uniref:Type II secretion system protein GspB C-terminal domain-containing protein n=1 Tax=Litoribrevibacter albus TaxID=1473156 RepID=A0AA37W7V1_9GAMM|nr:general secretion pathway protein GspB [Litoribrevibacter albus]GLQ31604.1 hypothetical protein GCM10007876_20830 [Litoribrevibacter albus]